MTTQEAVYRIFEQNANGYFQTRLVAVPLSSEEVYVNVIKEDPKTVLGRVLKKFGEQNWNEIKLDGHVSCYCPSSISDELRKIKQKLIDDMTRWDFD